MRLLSFVFLFIFAVSISAQSTKVDDLFTQGTKQINAGRFDDALTTYKSALATAEKQYAGKEYLARLHYNIGVCYFHLDRFEAAANEFKSAVLLKTDYSQAFTALRKAKSRADLNIASSSFGTE
jgi:tetratricopeptide (TPR) repeat protein